MILTAAVVLGHLFGSVWTGWVISSFGSRERPWAERWVLSVLVGIYAETLALATFLFLGLSLRRSMVATAGLVAAGTLVAWRAGRLTLPRCRLRRLAWYEWLLAVSVGEKLAFALWQLVRTHVGFDDTMVHWAGRARSLFGGVNWSLDPASPVFLAGHLAPRQYPLQSVLWQAATAAGIGHWNDVVARVDGVVYFTVIVATTWLAVRRFSGERWLAAAGAFVIAAAPLQVWHAAAGYGDIAVQAFALAALAALLRGDWFWAGILAASSGWSKNDGLILFVPALAVGLVLLQRPVDLARGFPWVRRDVWRAGGRFILGFATFTPWLLIKVAYGLSFGPYVLRPTRFAWHPDAPGLFWAFVITGPTSGILWACLFPAFLVLAAAVMWRDEVGRALAAVFVVSFGTIAVVFSCTSAHEWLWNQTAIHRSMLQFSGVAVLVVTCAIGRALCGHPVGAGEGPSLPSGASEE
jgi:hypothetical protein